MSAVFRRAQTDVRIVCQRGSEKLANGTKGSSCAVSDEGGNSNFSQDAQRAGSGVIIGGIAEAAVRGRDDIVKFAKRAHAGHRAEIEFPRKKLWPCAASVLSGSSRNAAGTRNSAGSATASAHSARSMQGHTAATPRNWRGAASASSPAIFSTRLPPMEYPAKKISRKRIPLDEFEQNGAVISGKA